MTEAINLAGLTAAPGGGGRFGASATGAGARAAGSAVATDAAAATQQSPAANAAAEAQAPTVREVEAAAQELQAYVQQSQSDLAFTVDEDLGRVIVSIVDREDGTVLRQIPGEEALRIAKAIAKLQDASGGLMQEVA